MESAALASDPSVAQVEERVLYMAATAPVSSSSAGGQTQTVCRQMRSSPSSACSFCNRLPRSSLGQGQMARYDPTPGFNPFKKGVRSKTSLSASNEPEGKKMRTANAASREVGQPRKRYGLEGHLALVENELFEVGLTEDLTLSRLFEETGHTWAHHCCAAWSEGVIQAEDYSLHYVDKAVVAGFAKKCQFCHQAGATINCRAVKCTRKFHYPCASAGGCFLDIKTLTLLCPEHSYQAEEKAGIEAQCVVCEDVGSVSKQLFCTSCGQHYHGHCLDPQIDTNSVVRAGWQCPDCKICQNCRKPGDDNKMLVCDVCDKGYHTYCLSPVVTEIPKNGWKCQKCRVCLDCRSKPNPASMSEKWHFNFTVCDRCHELRLEGNSCPICSRALTKLCTVLVCERCKKAVHEDCAIKGSSDTPAAESHGKTFICSVCSGSSKEALQATSSAAATALEKIDEEIERVPADQVSSLQGVDGISSSNFGADNSNQARSLNETQWDEDSAANPEDMGQPKLSHEHKGKGMMAPTAAGVSAAAAKKPCAGKKGGSTSQGKRGTSMVQPPPPRTVAQGKVFKKKQRNGGTSSDRRKHRAKARYAATYGLEGAGCHLPGGHASVSGAGGTSAQGGAGRGEAVACAISRLHHTQSLAGAAGGSSSSGVDEDPHSTVVLAAYNDEFALSQDMCVSCGSFGKGGEGALIVCTQCGQCYHPYCVQVKLTAVMIEKGWRCLDCTVCEGCGKACDEARLLLCDDCDISYHTYCLDPPLCQVPNGSWKCKWCVHCTVCGCTTPGFGCEWQNNYTECGPCGSLLVCPVCSIRYKEEELVMQCAHCERWLHSSCDGISTDDDVELVADAGYNCLYCRPVTGSAEPAAILTSAKAVPVLPPAAQQEATGVSTSADENGKSLALPLVSGDCVSSPRPVPEENRTYMIDGVCLSEAGMNQLKSIVLMATGVCGGVPGSGASTKSRSRSKKVRQTHPHMAQLLSKDAASAPDAYGASMGSADAKVVSVAPSAVAIATRKEDEPVDGSGSAATGASRAGAAPAAVGNGIAMEVDGSSGVIGASNVAADSGSNSAAVLPGDEPAYSPLTAEAMAVLEAAEEKKKEKVPHRAKASSGGSGANIGVGGFVARPPRVRPPAQPKTASGMGAAAGDTVPAAASNVSGAAAAAAAEPMQVDGLLREVAPEAIPPKAKSRSRKARQKSHIEDIYPPYLQEAFFGKSLLDKSRSGEESSQASFPPSATADGSSGSPAIPPNITSTPTGVMVAALSEPLLITASCKTGMATSSTNADSSGATCRTLDSSSAAADTLITSSAATDSAGEAESAVSTSTVIKGDGANFVMPSVDDIQNIDGDDFKDILPGDIDLHEDDLFKMLGAEDLEQSENQDPDADLTAKGGIEQLDVERMLKDEIDTKNLEDFLKGILAPAGPSAAEQQQQPLNKQLQQQQKQQHEQQLLIRSLQLNQELSRMESVPAISQLQVSSGASGIGTRPAGPVLVSPCAPHMEAGSQYGSHGQPLLPHVPLPAPVVAAEDAYAAVPPAYPIQSSPELQQPPKAHAFGDSVQPLADGYGGQLASGHTLTGWQPSVTSATGVIPSVVQMSGAQLQHHHVPAHVMAPSAATDASLQALSAEDAEGMSYNKRNMLKWKEDEELGLDATISPVLYVNTNYPELKTQYPDWAERGKHVTKLWRKVPSEERAPYLARARENRSKRNQTKAAQNKVNNDSKKQRRGKEPGTDSPAAAALQTTAATEHADDLTGAATLHGMTQAGSNTGDCVNSGSVVATLSPNANSQIAVHRQLSGPQLHATLVQPSPSPLPQDGMQGNSTGMAGTDRVPPDSVMMLHQQHSVDRVISGTQPADVQPSTGPLSLPLHCKDSTVAGHASVGEQAIDPPLAAGGGGGAEQPHSQSQAVPAESPLLPPAGLDSAGMGNVPRPTDDAGKQQLRELLASKRQQKILEQPHVTATAMVATSTPAIGNPGGIPNAWPSPLPTADGIAVAGAARGEGLPLSPGQPPQSPYRLPVTANLRIGQADHPNQRAVTPTRGPASVLVPGANSSDHLRYSLSPYGVGGPAKEVRLDGQGMLPVPAPWSASSVQRPPPRYAGPMMLPPRSLMPPGPGGGQFVGQPPGMRMYPMSPYVSASVAAPGGIETMGPMPDHPTAVAVNGGQVEAGRFDRPCRPGFPGHPIWMENSFARAPPSPMADDTTLNLRHQHPGAAQQLLRTAVTGQLIGRPQTSDVPVPASARAVSTASGMSAAGATCDDLEKQQQQQQDESDQLDDLLTPDGKFDLIQYADTGLDGTLVEEHDKNMFDEHLGLNKEAKDTMLDVTAMNMSSAQTGTRHSSNSSTFSGDTTGIGTSGTDRPAHLPGKKDGGMSPAVKQEPDERAQLHQTRSAHGSPAAASIGCGTASSAAVDRQQQQQQHTRSGGAPAATPPRGNTPLPPSSPRSSGSTAFRPMVSADALDSVMLARNPGSVPHSPVPQLNAPSSPWQPGVSRSPRATPVPSGTVARGPSTSSSPSGSSVPVTPVMGNVFQHSLASVPANGGAVMVTGMMTPPHPLSQASHALPQAPHPHQQQPPLPPPSPHRMMMMAPGSVVMPMSLTQQQHRPMGMTANMPMMTMHQQMQMHHFHQQQMLQQQHGITPMGGPSQMSHADGVQIAANYQQQQQMRMRPVPVVMAGGFNNAAASMPPQGGSVRMHGVAATSVGADPAGSAVSYPCPSPALQPDVAAAGPSWAAAGGSAQPGTGAVMVAPQQQQAAAPPPHLLHDLLEEEKRQQQQLKQQQQHEQQQQQHIQGIARKADGSLLSDSEYEKLKAEIVADNAAIGAVGAATAFAMPSSPMALPPHGMQQDGRFPRHALMENWRGQQPVADSAMVAAPAFPQPPPPYPGTERMGPSLVIQQQPPMQAAPFGFIPFNGPRLMMPENKDEPPPVHVAPSLPPHHHPHQQQMMMQHRQYDEWLRHHNHVLCDKVHAVEKRVTALKKTKKSLTNKQKQLKKNNEDLSLDDAQKLEQAIGECSVQQKDLDRLRKEHKQHQLVMQDYSHKQERLGFAPPIPPLMTAAGAPPASNAAGAAPAVGVISMATASGAMPPPSLTPAGLPHGPPGPMPPPVAAGGGGSIGHPSAPASRMRMPQAARREYDLYMQHRLQMQQQQRHLQQQGALPPRQPLFVGDDNNPFSDTYHQRERLEKMREQEEKQRASMALLEHHEAAGSSAARTAAAAACSQAQPAAPPPSSTPAAHAEAAATGVVDVAGAALPSDSDATMAASTHGQAGNVTSQQESGPGSNSGGQPMPQIHERGGAPMSFTGQQLYPGPKPISTPSPFKSGISNMEQKPITQVPLPANVPATLGSAMYPPQAQLAAVKPPLSLQGLNVAAAGVPDPGQCPASSAPSAPLCPVAAPGRAVASSPASGQSSLKCSTSPDVRHEEQASENVTVDGQKPCVVPPVGQQAAEAAIHEPTGVAVTQQVKVEPGQSNAPSCVADANRRGTAEAVVSSAPHRAHLTAPPGQQQQQHLPNILLKTLLCKPQQQPSGATADAPPPSSAELTGGEGVAMTTQLPSGEQAVKHGNTVDQPKSADADKIELSQVKPCASASSTTTQGLASKAETRAFEQLNAKDVTESRGGLALGLAAAARQAEHSTQQQSGAVPTSTAATAASSGAVLVHGPATKKSTKRPLTTGCATAASAEGSSAKKRNRKGKGTVATDPGSIVEQVVAGLRSLHAVALQEPSVQTTAASLLCSKHMLSLPAGRPPPQPAQPPTAIAPAVPGRPGVMTAPQQHAAAPSPPHQMPAASGSVPAAAANVFGTAALLKGDYGMAVHDVVFDRYRYQPYTSVPPLSSRANGTTSTTLPGVPFSGAGDCLPMPPQMLSDMPRKGPAKGRLGSGAADSECYDLARLRQQVIPAPPELRRAMVLPTPPLIAPRLDVKARLSASPDTMLSSSSPECDDGDPKTASAIGRNGWSTEELCLPYLRLIRGDSKQQEEEEAQRSCCASPALPLLAPVALRRSAPPPGGGAVALTAQQQQCHRQVHNTEDAGTGTGYTCLDRASSVGAAAPLSEKERGCGGAHVQPLALTSGGVTGAAAFSHGSNATAPGFDASASTATGAAADSAYFGHASKPCPSSPPPPPPPYSHVQAHRRASSYSAAQPASGSAAVAALPNGQDGLKATAAGIKSSLQSAIRQSPSQQVSFTLTLSSTAAQDIPGVLSALADLLRMSVPTAYTVSRSPSPPLPLPYRCVNAGHPLLPASDKEGSLQCTSAPAPRLLSKQYGGHQRPCSNCGAPVHVHGDVGEQRAGGSGVKAVGNVLDTVNGYTKLDIAPEKDNEIVLCSALCRSQWALASRQLVQPLCPPESSNTGGILMNKKSLDTSLDSTASAEVVATQMAVVSMRTSPPPVSLLPAVARHAVVQKPPVDSAAPLQQKPRGSAAAVCSGTDKNRRRPLSSEHAIVVASVVGTRPPQAPPQKKWKGQRWRHWDCKFSLLVQRSSCAAAPPHMSKDGASAGLSLLSPEQGPGHAGLYAIGTPPVTGSVSAAMLNLLNELRIVVKPDPAPDDRRQCILCHKVGDGESNGPARLLNYDADKWVHLNCALWSSEVYETLNGALINVEAAVKRGALLDCVVCRQRGATMSCFKQRCPNIYHIGCALLKGCMFFQDKTILCPVHMPREHNDELKTVAVFRKVYVNRNEAQQLASVVHELDDERSYKVRVGALVFHSVGQLFIHQISTGKFHSRDYIYPVGYRATRYYWSMRSMRRRCRYECTIHECDGRPEFSITVREAGFDDLVVKDTTAQGVWSLILEQAEKIRREGGLVKIFPAFLRGEHLFGLTEPCIVRVIESLPGAELLAGYAFKFGRTQLIEMPLAVNPTGCARSEPKLRTHFRRPHTVQTSSRSHSLPSTVTGIIGDVNSPYMKQFVHSKSQQYRRLKTEWRNYVYLGRSRIQGLGLFAARDIEKHTMMIEYIGEIIRNELAEMREKIYEKQNRGVYMFRVTPDLVCDATMAGGPARYVNHSCAPNCVAEIVNLEKECKIIIIANRRLAKGEELTYDYKFDFEDDQHKIPCNCGAPNCRKWMN